MPSWKLARTLYGGHGHILILSSCQSPGEYIHKIVVEIGGKTYRYF